MKTSQADLNRFYDLLSLLEESGQQGKPLKSYSGSSAFPARGVYFFRDAGEYRTTEPSVPRIVRVGTHAVSANAKSTLWGRLRTHRGTRSGSGNHRGSIFRLHVGAALQARDGLSIPSWMSGSSTPHAVRMSPTAQAAEAACERRVSEYIGAMTVLWANVPDEPGPNSMRARIEQNAIALLSNGASLDPASPNWLGRCSPRLEIRQSCLWNLNHVSQRYDPGFLDDLAAAVGATLRIELLRL